MKYRSKVFFTVLLFALLVLALPVSAAESKEGNGLKSNVTILYTSDVHCGVDQNFGYAGLYEVKKHFEDAGDHVLLVDNGDSIQGEAMGTVTKGEANIKLMNALGYDIAIPGNHEFDYGMEQFLNLVKMADFPYISCNFNKEGRLVFKPYIIKEFDGVKIAFVGVTTPKTLTSSTPEYFQDMNKKFIYGFFQDPTGKKLCDAVQKAVDDARAEGADYVIMMSHLGNQAENRPSYTYADILENTSGIDAVIDGHSHDDEQVTMKNKDGIDVPRSACGTKMSGIGYCVIDPKGGVKCGVFKYENSLSITDLMNIDNEISKAVKGQSDELKKELSKVVAKTDVDLTISDPVKVDDDGRPVRLIRRAETNLGDLCADAYLDALGSDIAFINGGGVRTSIPRGDITLEQILQVHPYNNSLSVIKAKGQQILDALEWGARALPAETGAFLHPAGLSYEIHSYIPSGCKKDENGLFIGVEGEYRVKNVKVGDEPLDPDKEYTIASIDYILIQQGDGFTMFDGAEVLRQGVKLDNQILIDYITETLGGVVGEEYSDPYGQGRIVIYDELPGGEKEAETADTKGGRAASEKSDNKKADKSKAL